MNAWQRHVMLEAEEAANMCIACGQYGHYPVECPEEHPLPSLRLVKQRNRIHLAACVIWFVVSLVVGMWIKEGF